MFVFPLPDQDVHVPSHRPADGNTRHHGAGDSAGHAGNPLPEKWQRWRGDRGLPVQPGGSAHLGLVRKHLLSGWRRGVDPAAAPTEKNCSLICCFANNRSGEGLFKGAKLHGWGKKCLIPKLLVKINANYKNMQMVDLFTLNLYIYWQLLVPVVNGKRFLSLVIMIWTKS